MEGASGYSLSYRGRPGRGRGDFGRRDGQRGGRREHATRRETHPDDFRELSVIPTFEDIHTDKDPFLRPNIVRGRYPDVDTYLDVQFRLLREDFVRPLREGITDFLNMRRRGSGRQAGTPQDIYVYYDVHVAYPTYAHNGIVYRIQFDSSRPELQRVRWQQSKRLIYGSLVCLSSDEFQTMFIATVANRDPKQLGQGWVEVRFEGDTSEVLDISPMETFIMVESTAFFEAYRHVLKGLQEVDQNTMPFIKYIVDCDCANGVDPPAYLRNEYVTYDLSVVAENVHPSCARSVRSVAVLRDNMWPSAEDLNFDESQYRAFKLGLTKEFAIIQGPPGTGKTYIGLKIIEVLLRNSHKWRGVQRGLEAAGPILVVCYTNHALDQFLEGIAESYPEGIVRVGGQSKSDKLKQFNLTNIKNKRRQRKKLHGRGHKGAADATRKMKRLQEKMDVYLNKLTATQSGLLHEDTLMLDQLHRDSLMQGSAKQNEDGWMIGGNRKKRESVIVDWLGLGEQALPGADRQNHDSQADDEEEVGIEIMDDPEEQRLLDDVEMLHSRGNSGQHRRNDDSVVDLALDLENMQIKDRQAGNAEGWQVQANKKRRRNALRRELSKTEMMTDEDVQDVRNVWKLELRDRWRLYRYWLAKYHAYHRQSISKFVDQYEDVARRLEGYRIEENRKIMEEARVIGMTTTGAAKYRSILQDIQPAIVIVEEAAEVLEAHIFTTLSQHCQHLILIGDHQQLRPKPTVYDLETNYNMGISLFERMIMNGMQCQRLQSQHRMRPEFARLLTPHIYESLDNHESVLNFDNIKGVSSNMFFVDHNHREEQKRDTKSRSNMHEAEFMASFCRYLLQQGYRPSQITILTTYTGQLFNFKKAMPRQVFEGVRVSTVDSFQGEESDIILLSLVRSNDEGNVGFLKVDNRVCVALSRAKKGFYAIGNLMMLAKASTLWIKIIQELLQQKSVGETLTLSCQNHPDSEILVSTSDDFKKAPNGGCMRSCTFRLQCGHVCEMRCHPTDPDHEEYKCQKPCNKVICDLRHRCQRLCCQPCGKCQVLVDKTFPRCPHKQTIPCYKKDDDDLVCNAPCTRLFKCGHRCAGTCDSCRQRRMHEPCREPCNRVLVCSHQCSALCGKPCVPCQEPCEWRCKHHKCDRPCGEPCDRPRCNKPCRKTRFCGKCKKARPCIGMCGEPCPDKCRICDREELTEIIFGTEDEPDARFLQLQDCGHVIEVRRLDQWMDITDRDIRLKTCPKCKTPIRHNLRYGNTIKKTMAKIKKVQNVPNTQRETPTSRLLGKNRSRGVDQREHRATSADYLWHGEQDESRLSSQDQTGATQEVARRKKDQDVTTNRFFTENRGDDIMREYRAKSATYLRQEVESRLSSPDKGATPKIVRRKKDYEATTSKLLDENRGDDIRGYRAKSATYVRQQVERAMSSPDQEGTSKIARRNKDQEDTANRLFNESVDQREYRRAQSAASFWHDQQVESRLSSPNKGATAKIVRRKKDDEATTSKLLDENRGDDIQGYRAKPATYVRQQVERLMSSPAPDQEVTTQKIVRRKKDQEATASRMLNENRGVNLREYRTEAVANQGATQKIVRRKKDDEATTKSRLLNENRGVNLHGYRAESVATACQQVESRLSSPDHQGAMKKMVRRKEDKGGENERQITELQRDIDDLEKWLGGTADAREKFGGELTRLKYLLKLRILQRRIRKNGISLDELEQKYLAMAERRLTGGEPLTEQKEEFVKHVLSRLSRS